MRMHPVFFCFPILALASCDDKGTTPPMGGFSVRVRATRITGEAVPGLRISVWNHLLNTVPAPDRPPSTLAGMTIQFSVAQVSRVTLAITEFDGTPVRTILDQHLAPGVYRDLVTIDEAVPTRVYAYHLTARDTGSGAVLFDSSRTAVLWQPDADVSILGRTGADGFFTTANPLFFPNTLSLPPLIATTASGPDSIGLFFLADSVTFVLTDTVAHQQMVYSRGITGGRNNEIGLVWNPTRPGDALPAASRPRSTVDLRTVPDPPAPFQWRLEQSFPNPFN